MRVRINGLNSEQSRATAISMLTEMQSQYFRNGHLPYLIDCWAVLADGKVEIDFGDSLRRAHWGMFIARNMYGKPVPLKPLLRKLRKLRCLT